MKKMKLLTVVLLCFGTATVAWSVEVINIDINGYYDRSPYTGTAAYPGGSTWQAYYGGWGIAVGSASTQNLADNDEPNRPGVYAAQVWIGEPGTAHWYTWGSGLMDDGFYDNNSVADPCIHLFGVDAYTGTFDIYVYGVNDGNFTLSSPIYGPNTKHITGGFDGNFVEGQNYVVFNDVLIDDTNEVVLIYDGTLNGLQLVKQKEPVVIQDGTQLTAINYDIAGDTNRRTDELATFGPDIGTAVHYLDEGEFMEYDIVVDDANEGQYEITAYLATEWGDADNLDIYLDDEYMGTFYLYYSSSDFIPSDNTITLNLFEGSHRFKWVTSGPEIYFDIGWFEFNRIGDVVMNDCNDVDIYGLNYTADLNNDCHVDANDLAVLVGSWVNCNDPENCP